MKSNFFRKFLSLFKGLCLVIPISAQGNSRFKFEYDYLYHMPILKMHVQNRKDAHWIPANRAQLRKFVANKNKHPQIYRDLKDALNGEDPEAFISTLQTNKGPISLSNLGQYQEIRRRQKRFKFEYDPGKKQEVLKMYVFASQSWEVVDRKKMKKALSDKVRNLEMIAHLKDALGGEDPDLFFGNYLRANNRPVLKDHLLAYKKEQQEKERPYNLKNQESNQKYYDYNDYLEWQRWLKLFHGRKQLQEANFSDWQRQQATLIQRFDEDKKKDPNREQQQFYLSYQKWHQDQSQKWRQHQHAPVSSHKAPPPPLPSTTSDCMEFDHTKFSSPTRDQGHYSFCWAFASTSLLEEEFCMSDPKLCGQPLSVLDFAKRRDILGHLGVHSGQGRDSRTWKLGQSNESFHPDLALRKYVMDRPSSDGTIHPQEGICIEDNAPYALSCPYSGYSPKCAVEILKNEFHRYKMAKRSSVRMCQKDGTPPPPLQAIIDNVLALVQSINPQIWRDLVQQNPERSRPIIRDALELNQVEDFLQSVFITSKCVQNRFQLPKGTLDVHNTFYPLCEDSDIDCRNNPSQLQQTRNDIMSYFRDNRSAGILICASRFQDRNGGLLGPVATGDCGQHAVIANGMKRKYNPRTGKAECYINLKNSWGEPATLHGEYRLDDILPFIYGTFGLRPKGH